MSIAVQTPLLAPPADSGPVVAIDLDAVASNVRHFLASAPHAELMAVVKADGFGHGAQAVALTALANGAAWLGVTSIAEGLALRAVGLTAPMLSWLNSPDADFAAAHRAGIDVAVPGLAQLRAAVDGARSDPTRAVRLHLQIDCGMARDGAAPDAWPTLCRAARRAERQGRAQVVGIMGHLACADDPTHPSNQAGRERFAWAVSMARTVGLHPHHRHLAATAATLNDPAARHTLCRVGAGLVGIDPSGLTRLRQPMTLTAPVVSVRDVETGTAVGYGHSWTTRRPTRLALLQIGYADGLPRVASNRAEVLLGGRRCPVVGRVSMDQTVVDLGGAMATPGERALVFGPGDDGEPTVREWAQWCGTIEHEIVTGLGHRVRRHMEKERDHG